MRTDLHYPFSFCKRRGGFTLIELLLALGLTVLVTALIGGLLQIYIVQQTSSQDRIEQIQVARGLLARISDDIRGVIRFQTYDDGPLQELLGGAAAGSLPTGGAESGTAAPGAGGITDSASLSSPSSSAGAASGLPPELTGATGNASGSFSGSQSGQQSQSVEPEPPPGIYGTENQLQIDVSRIPRADEYFPQQNGLLTGAIDDVPSDLKTVTYFVQQNTIQGVRDPFANSNGGRNGNAGLVRRQLDRAVLRQLNAQGLQTQLNQTGELIGPEVIAVSFSYFDGTQWLVNWNSSEQGLPLLIRVRVAVGPKFPVEGAPVIEPGSNLSLISNAQLQAANVVVYESLVSIPGAILFNVDAAAQSGATGDAEGLESLGL